MTNERHFKVVVAIDFGTSRSGYAYAFRGNDPTPHIYERIDWPDMLMKTPKTLTHLLYAPTGTPEAWGASARLRQAELMREGKSKEYIFVQSFKMDLRNNKTPDGPVTERGNKTFRTENLIADYLKCLKEKALADLVSTVGNSLQAEDVLWCLTVPAIWSASEKQIMRNAAQKAGLISPLASDADRLCFALEPEAAALHCAKRAEIALQVGERFMVVDCGGGTVDITTFEVLPDGQYKPVTTPDGGPYGATYVDQQFLKYLREKTSLEAITKFQSAEPVGYVRLLETWETIKCQFDPEKNAAVTWFDFPIRLHRLLETDYPDILKTLLDKQNDNQGLDIARDEMLQFFEPSLKGTEAAIQQQLKQLEKDNPRCDYLFLVGGFSASPVMQQHIKKNFGNRVKAIIVPANPEGAIVNGAVYFALNPGGLLPVRPAPYTYGCAFSAPFREGVDLTNKKWIEKTGKVYCKDRFDVFVVAKQPVAYEQCITRTYSPSNPDATSMKLSLYATQNPDPVYVDGKDVQLLGEIEVQMPDKTGGAARTVAVTMKFGQTEIGVSALDMTTKRNYDVAFKLDPTL